MHDDLVATLRTLAPLDLPAETPLYVLFASDPGCGHLIPDCAAGITSPYCDLAARPALEASGDWRGRGAAVAIDVGAAANAAWDLIGEGGEHFLTARDGIAWSLLLHEAAHVLERPVQTDEAESFIAAADVPAMWAAASALPPPAEKPPWHQHGPTFIRSLCHLSARAKTAGIDHHDNYTFAHEAYNLSPLADYRATLAEEIADSSELSFAEIRATRPPQAFIDLWTADMAAWYESTTIPTAVEFLSSALHAFDGLPERIAPMVASALALCAIADFGDTFTAQLQASAGKPSPTKFTATAYSGGPLPGHLFRQDNPVVIDLAGVERSRNVVAYLDDTRVGHVDLVDNDGSKLDIEGVLSFHGSKRDEIIGSARNGFPWAVTVRTDIDQIERLPLGKSTVVNGRTIEGPANIARKSKLAGVEFDSHHVGDGTEVFIHASEYL